MIDALVKCCKQMDCKTVFFDQRSHSPQTFNEPTALHSKENNNLTHNVEFFDALKSSHKTSATLIRAHSLIGVGSFFCAKT